MRDDHTLLMVISEKIDTIKEDLKELKDDIRGRAKDTDLKTLAEEVSSIKKKQDEHEKKIVAWSSAAATGAGILSYLAQHLIR